jgi:integrase
MPAAVTITFNGQSRTAAEWSAITKLPRAVILQRIGKLGHTPEQALTKPVRESGRRGGRFPAGEPRPCPRLKSRANGKAYCRWRKGGKVFDRCFGAAGSPEALAAYRRFAAEWARGDILAPIPSEGISLDALALKWLAHVDETYRKDGKRTSEYSLALAACKGLHRTLADRLAADMTPEDLRTVRAAWLAKGHALNTIKSYQNRVVKLFGWAVGQSLVVPAVHQALQQVEYLKAGRTTARDPEPRKPANDEQIAAVLPYLSPRETRRQTLADMIQLQRLTGMRPGEVCALKPADVDRSADVWLYEVGKANKNRHRGKAQVYYFGPKAVAILRPYLVGADEVAPVFGVTAKCYGDAVRAACVKAQCERWTPHQLRHAFATEVARVFRTLSHAAAAIGDTQATTAAFYLHVDPQERAKIEVARAMG